MSRTADSIRAKRLAALTGLAAFALMLLPLVPALASEADWCGSTKAGMAAWEKSRQARLGREREAAAAASAAAPTPTPAPRRPAPSQPRVAVPRETPSPFFSTFPGIEGGPDIEAFAFINETPSEHFATMRIDRTLYRFRRLSDCPPFPNADTPDHAVRRVLAALLAQDQQALDEMLANGADLGAMNPLFPVRLKGFCGLSGGAPIEHAVLEGGKAANTRRRVSIDTLTLTLRTAQGRVPVTTPRRVQLLLVRGDAAELAVGAHADAGRWYVEGWIEGGEGEADESELKTSSPAPKDSVAIEVRPLALAIRRVSALTEWPIRLALTLPREDAARLAIYDVAGRVMLTRDLGGLAPGDHTIELADRRLMPGVYWLRLKQAREERQLKLIILR